MTAKLLLMRVKVFSPFPLPDSNSLLRSTSVNLCIPLSRSPLYKSGVLLTPLDVAANALERLLRERLQLLGETEGEEQKREPLLKPFDIDGVANFIKELDKKQGG